MKRNTIGLLLHPYKNGLIPKGILRETIDRFFRKLFSLHHSFPQLRFNIVISGYILECTDQLLLAQLRDLCSRNITELVCTGYTEPFLSLSPPGLTIRNLHYGLQVIEELTGKRPQGFLPPFSNWEPSFISELRSLGFRYALLASELFTPETRSACGYWVAEHAGSSIGVIGTHLTGINTTAGYFDFLQNIFTNNSHPVSAPFIAPFHLLPLCSDATDDAYRFLDESVAEIEKNLLSLQPVCFGEFLGTVNPVGLQHIPASLQMSRRGSPDLHFPNHLFSFDQVGFMQRKLLDVYGRMEAFDRRTAAPLLRELFSVQDINRFLPNDESGFEIPADRETTYRRLIAVDLQVRRLNGSTGSRVGITDFLRNGGKTIILSNGRIKTFIEHLSGGQITGFDYRERSVNLCSVYNPVRYHQPDIIVTGSSRTWFCDRILADRGNEPDSSSQLEADTSDFKSSEFDYKIHKTSHGINVSLIRTGSFSSDDRLCPLNIEKVFGLEKDNAELSFVYQYTNPSLMTCSFIFSTELYLHLPGIVTGNAHLTAGKSRYTTIGREVLRLPHITSWNIEDRKAGIQFILHTQKPVTFWCIPPSPPEKPVEGVRIILTTAISLNPSAQSKCIGKIICKSMKKENGETDAV